MAPTICSEKKPRPMRTNLKEIRRQPNSTTSATAGGATTVSNVNGKAASNASSVMDYVAATRNMRSRIKSEISNTIENSSLHSMGVNRLRLESDQQQQHQTTGNIVSSSEMRLELLRAVTANQMDVDSNITDEEDCEVHSITSGIHYNNNRNIHNNTTSCNSINHQHRRQFPHCCNDDKTVFQAIPTGSMLSDKQNLINIATAYNNNKNKNNKLQHFTCIEDEQSSDSYTSMCEIKNTEGLLAIALKTIKLVKRNQMLQRRLTELQLETSEFIESVLANPENRHFRGKMQSPVTSSPQLSSAVTSPLSSRSSSQSPQSITTTAMTRRLNQSASEA